MIRTRAAGRTLALALAALCAAATAADSLETAPWPLRPAAAPIVELGGVRFLGSLVIERGRVDGLDVLELSGLAWDSDEGLLYALSDRGYLFHLRPVFEGGRLVDLEAVAGHPLRDARGRRLGGALADSEGLDLAGGRNGVAGDARLLISFERHPRVMAYTPRGEELQTYPLPDPLGSADAYASPNKGLESLTLHPRLGLLTAPEWPLAGRGWQLAIRGLEGGIWTHTLHRSLNMAITAMEALPDGSLLVLERGHGLLYLPIVIAIRRTGVLTLPGGPLATRELAVLDSSQGWSVDNFEGLTRHEGSRFFMVSDDNGRALQRTLVVYFETRDTDNFEKP